MLPDNNNNQQTTQQRRAASAYPQVESVSKAAYKKEYKSLVRGFGAMIQIDGLGAALAFLKAKAGGKPDSAHAKLYMHLETWMKSWMEKHLENWTAVHQQTSGELLNSVIALDSTRYRQAAVEVQSYLMWLKRFAEALIEGESSDRP